MFDNVFRKQPSTTQKYHDSQVNFPILHNLGLSDLNTLKNMVYLKL